MLRTFSLLAGLAGLAGILSAQTIDQGSFIASYFSNANTGTTCPVVSGNVVCMDADPQLPDATLQLINTGTSGGNLCADIYVFDPNQELSECCSCLLTPDGLDTLSVNRDLTADPLTGTPLTNGSVQILSAATTGGNCPLPTSPKPAPGIIAWATHIQTDGSITEAASSAAGLSAPELSSLGAKCSAIRLVGSGAGVCTCGKHTG